MASRLASIILLAGFLSTINAANLTSTGCADASAFESCSGDVALTTQNCLNNARESGSELETAACGCVDYIDNYNCYAASCWNRVYECEYQMYVIEYLEYCPVSETPVIPYFPAPDDAPDSCSCNLGKVYNAVTASTNEYGVCENNVSAIADIDGCACCGESTGLSAIYDICPDTDPTLIGLTTVQSIYNILLGSFSTCNSLLSEYNCASDFGYATPVGGKFLNADELVNGTATLSNTPGTVTAPPSGTLYSYTNPAADTEYTISAEGVSKNSAATTTESSGKSSSTKSSGKASSTSASGSDSTGSSTSSDSSSTAGVKSAGKMLRSGFETIAVGVTCIAVAAWFLS